MTLRRGQVFWHEGRPYVVGERPPRCWHDRNQPADMCTTCRGRVDVRQWHAANRAFVAGQEEP